MADPGPKFTTRSWDSIVREADPNFDQEKRKVPVYTFGEAQGKVRTFYDKINPYSGTST